MLQHAENPWKSSESEECMNLFEVFNIAWYERLIISEKSEDYIRK